MKKKFVLTLALVLMVAATLTAAPIELSGYFKSGYKMTFQSSGNGIAPYSASEVSLNNLSLTGDFWKIAFADMKAGDVIEFDGDNRLNEATASIYLDKALAAQGVDMGDLAVTLTIGNKTTLGGLSVYANSRDDLSGLEMAGVSESVAVGVDYGTLASFYVGADLASFDTANKPVVLSAKFMPVDGVKAAVAYTNIDSDSADGSVAGSVAADVAALAGLDFGLEVSVYDIFLLAGDVNRLYVEAKASYEDVSGYVEYRIVDDVNGLKVNASYAGIENVGLSAYVTLSDLTDKTVAGADTEIGAGATYTMGGVKYAADVAYVTSTKALTLTPSVKISF